MTEAEARARIEALRRDITKHNRRYYEEAAPTITDREYDQLYRELAELEEKMSAIRSQGFANPPCRRATTQAIRAGTASRADA
jgi:NAD-dependent DNA ligase